MNKTDCFRYHDEYMYVKKYKINCCTYLKLLTYHMFKKNVCTTYLDYKITNVIFLIWFIRAPDKLHFGVITQSNLTKTQLLKLLMGFETLLNKKLPYILTTSWVFTQKHWTEVGWLCKSGLIPNAQKTCYCSSSIL